MQHPGDRVACYSKTAHLMLLFGNGRSIKDRGLCLNHLGTRFAVCFHGQKQAASLRGSLLALGT